MASDKSLIINGIVWNSVQKYSGLVVSTIISMVLARLLTPEEFGIVAIATVIISFLAILSDMGIGPAIIQRRDFKEEDINNVFTFSCIVGLILSLMLFGLSWLLAYLYEMPKLRPVCQILTVNVFFASANMVPNALMSKNFRFKEIAKRTLFLQIITGVLSIIAAFLGTGVYALLISPVLTSIGIFVFNRYYYKVNISKNFSLSPIKKIYSYSSYQFLFQFITYFSANTDKILIGKYISSGDLGYYQKSHQLVQLPLGSVGAVINPVLQPVLTKYQDEKEELAKRYNKIIHILATVSFPAGVLMYFCGYEIIRLFYGSQWDLAVPAFKIISLVAPIQIILNSSGSFFQAANETKRLFQLGTLNAICSISLTILAIIFIRTIESVALAWSITNVVGLFTTYFFMYVLVLKKPFHFALKEFVFPISLSVVTAIILNVENLFFSRYFILGFIIKIITTIILILVSLQISKQFDVIGFLKRRISKTRFNNAKK